MALRAGSRHTAAAVLLALAAGAFYLGRAQARLPAGTPAMAAQGSVDRAPASKGEQPGAACTRDRPTLARLATAEQRLRILALVAGARRAAAAGEERPSVPRPFPPDLDPAATPSRFRETAAVALEGCFPGLRVTDADCSEYPCIAWASADGTEPALDLAGCEPWARQMGDTSVVYRFTAPDGAGSFLGIATTRGRASPGDAPYDRTQARMADLAEAYGARGP